MKGTVFNDMIDQAILQVHTGFCAKVVGVAGNLASVQPLDMIQAPRCQPRKQAVIPNCPVLQGARKFVPKAGTTGSAGNPSHTHSISTWEIIGPSLGDTVFCVCADRDISETRTGNFAKPVSGHHSIAGAVVVGIL